MDAADLVWNRAADGWDPATWVGLREGDRALAAMLLVHGLVQNGGVPHAIEGTESDEIRRGIEGYRYFELDRVADLIDVAAAQKSRLQLSSLGVREELELLWNRAYQELLPTDQALVDAFEALFARSPAAFAPPGQELTKPPSPVPPGMPSVTFDIDPATWEVELISMAGRSLKVHHGDTLEPELGVYRMRVNDRVVPMRAFERGMRGTMVVRPGLGGRPPRVTFSQSGRGEA